MSTAHSLQDRPSRQAAADLAQVTPARISQLGSQLGRHVDRQTGEITFDAAAVARYAAERRIRRSRP